jgi:hypothetical protein
MSGSALKGQLNEGAIFRILFPARQKVDIMSKAESG